MWNTFGIHWERLSLNGYHTKLFENHEIVGPRSGVKVFENHDMFGQRSGVKVPSRIKRDHARMRGGGVGLIKNHETSRSHYLNKRSGGGYMGRDPPGQGMVLARGISP